MKKNKKLAVIVSMLIIIAGVKEYNPMMNYFIGQAKNPKGFIGSVMTKIWNNTFSNMTDWALGKVTIQDDFQILDVGFGGGETIRKLVELTPNGNVFGIDISDEAVKTATEVNKEAVESGIVILSNQNVQNMAFDDNTFFFVTAIQTHIYWDDVRLGFSEIYRVLKFGGMVAIPCEIDKIDYHFAAYKDHQKFVNLLTDIGFKDVTYSIQGNWVCFIGRK